jgi:hypothetical protein
MSEELDVEEEAAAAADEDAAGDEAAAKGCNPGNARIKATPRRRH